MILLSLLLACVDPNAPVHPGEDTPFEFEVPAGSSASTLGDELTAAGLAPSEFQWKMFLRQTDGSCLKAGRFKVAKSMSMAEVLETLCGVPLADDEPFAVLEGWRIRDIDEALAAKGWIEAGAYIATAKPDKVDAPFDVKGSLEGYLYPETYMVEPDRFEVKTFIERQLGMFHDRFGKEHAGGVGGRSLDEIVIMASMLEREEPKPEQRPMVAGILWKRIDNSWMLGVDATSRYTLDKWNDRRAFLKKLRDPDDPYNTRLRGGLPPTAIGNPSLPSLEAASAPTESEFWYYLHDANKVLRPARNNAEHEANRRKYNVY